MATTQCRHTPNGRMAKLVDALDLGSSGETHKSSSLFTPTNLLILGNHGDCDSSGATINQYTG